MNSPRLLRSLPALALAWLAVLSLQWAQPGALVHHWEHAFGHHHAEGEGGARSLASSAAVALEVGACPEGAARSHAGTEPAAQGDRAGCTAPDASPGSGHEGLCNLCAHFASLAGLQSAQPGLPAVRVPQALPVALLEQCPPSRPARERYAARAPPVFLS